MRNLKISKILMILLSIFALSLIFSLNRAEASTKSIAFDATYYADTNSDVKAVFGYDETLLKNHWVKYGVSEGRSASPAFDVKYYVESNSDLQVAFGTNYVAAYNHFVDYGVTEGRTTSKVFDVRSYLNLNGDLKAAFKTNYKAAYEHFINYGIAEGRNTSVAFNVQAYLNGNSDLKTAFKTNYMAAYEHFINYGITEGRTTSQVFDVKYYVNNNGDLKAAFGTNYKAAYEHFLNYGMAEGRKAIGTFDVKYYLNNNGDLKAAFGTNYKLTFEHYVNYGMAEGRKAVSSPTISKTLSASDISNNASKYYGKTVKYTPANNDTSVAWKVFYADNENIYIIADKGIDKTKVTMNSEITDVSGIDSKIAKKWLTWQLVNSSASDTRAIQTAKLLDTSVWNAEYGNSNAEYAIGTPTLEMFIASWNARGYNKITVAYNAEGYRISSIDGIEVSESSGGTSFGSTLKIYDYYDLSTTQGYNDTLYFADDSGMWLASPYNASFVYYGTMSSAMPTLIVNGNIGPFWLSLGDPYGYRPVVCLKSGTQLVEQANGTYAIK